MEKPCISRPIIVEGKYDKIKLDSLFSAYIIPTDGFALFKKRKSGRFSVAWRKGRVSSS